MIGAALLATALVLPAAPAQGANKCRTSSTTGGARVVERTSSAVVFTKRDGVYGCVYSGGPIKRLLDEGGGIKLGRGGDVAPEISGRYVAYATYGSAIGDEFDRVVVWDLKVGKVRFELGSNIVRALAVKSNGSVAWIQGSVVEPANRDVPVYEVHALSAADREGDLLLDRGSDISPGTLGLSANREAVMWTRGGAQRSSSLR